MTKYGIWIMMEAGQCLVHKDFSHSLIDEDLLSGFQSAILTYADMKIKSIVADDIRFLYESSFNPRLIFILAADVNVEVKRLEDFLSVVKSEFLKDYKQAIPTWSGDLKIFKPFEEKLDKLMREWLVKSVTLDTVLERTKATFKAMIPSSRENKEISDLFGNEGIDVIALVDGVKSLEDITESLGLDQEKTIEIAEYAIASGFAQEQTTSTKEKSWEEIIEEEYPFPWELEHESESDLEVKKEIEEKIKEGVELKTQEKLLGKRKEGELDEQTITAVTEITKEFEKRFGTLEAKAQRLPDHIIEQIEAEFSCPVSIAKIAYQIELDGALSVSDACNEIMTELKRRKSVGMPIPAVYTHEFAFALTEGQWIEYLRKKFVKNLEQSIRELANLERAVLDEKKKPVEKIIQLLDERRKIIKENIYPILKKWIQDHVRTKPIDGATTMTAALKQVSPSEAYLLLRNGKSKLFQTLRSITPVLEANKEDSKEVEQAFQDYSALIVELEQPLDYIGKRALSEIILEIAPRPKIRINEYSSASYLLTHSPLNKSGLTGPELTDPADFLERDIRLARRRGDERDTLIQNSIKKVYRALNSGLGFSQLHSGALILSKLNLRFDLPVISTYDACVNLKNNLKETNDMDERDEHITNYVFNYVLENILRESPSSEISQQDSSNSAKSPPSDNGA